MDTGKWERKNRVIVHSWQNVGRFLGTH